MMINFNCEDRPFRVHRICSMYRTMILHNLYSEINFGLLANFPSSNDTSYGSDERIISKKEANEFVALEMMIHEKISYQQQNNKTK